MLLARVIMAAALVATACGPGDEVVCLGDCELPLELAPVGIRDGQVVALAEGAVVSIERPLQGGWVIYAGARARNVHERGATITGALRSTTGPSVVSLEERSVGFVLDTDGWARPEYARQDLSNMPVCDVVPGPDDFDAMTWRLELTLRDRDGRTATTALVIAPQCPTDDPGCGCDCRFDQTTACPMPSVTDAL